MISNRKRARSTRHNYQLNCSHELPKFITNFTSNPVVSFALTPSRLMDMYHSHTHRQSLIKNLIISVHCDIIVLNLPVKEVLNVRQLGLRQKPRYLSKYRVSKSFIEICRGSSCRITFPKWYYRETRFLETILSFETKVSGV